eukprot:2426595-Amphidinium_carterae.1
MQLLQQLVHKKAPLFKFAWWLCDTHNHNSPPIEAKKCRRPKVRGYKERSDEVQQAKPQYQHSTLWTVLDNLHR